MNFSKNTFLKPYTATHILLGPLLAIPVFASEGGGAHTSLFPFWVNFILYAVFLTTIVYFFRKSIILGWHSRSETIAKNIRNSKEELERSEDDLSLIETRMSNIAYEINEISKQVEMEMEREYQTFLNEAEKRAIDIVKRGHESAESERLASERTLRDEIISAISRRTEEILRDRVGPDNDEKRRHKALDNFGKILHY